MARALVIACAFPLLAAAQEKEPDWFPLQVGLKWEYTDAKGGKVASEITEKKDDGGERFVLKVADGATTTELRYARGDDGVTLTYKALLSGGKTHDRGIQKPRLFLKKSMKKGDQWDFGVAGDGSREAAFKVEHLGDEKVTVAAGTYPCAKLRYVWNAEGPVANAAPTRVTRTIWLAADVGIVKETTESVGGTAPDPVRTLELSKFERGGSK
jgi:hypothetical protein